MSKIVYCEDLSLNGLGPLRDDIDWRTYISDDKYQKVMTIDDLNPKVVELLKNMGVGIRWIECFFLDPSKKMSGYNPDYYHIDSPGGGDYIKLNWIYGGKDSKMFWALPKDGKESPIQTSAAGTKYRGYHVNDLDIVHEHQVGFPSIVQIGVAHNVHNSVEPRLCVCITPGKDKKDLTMEQALEIFKDFRISNGQ
jgi:hypothetical protein